MTNNTKNNDLKQSFLFFETINIADKIFIDNPGPTD